MLQIDKININRSTSMARIDVTQDEINTIKPQVRNYAGDNPSGFVAEDWATMLNGVEFTEDIIKLYVKYRGIEPE